MSLSFNFVFLRCRTEDFQRTAQEQLFKYLLLSWTLVPDRSAKLHVRGLCHQDICFPAFLKLIFIIYFLLNFPYFGPCGYWFASLCSFISPYFFSLTLENPRNSHGIEHTVQAHLWAQGESFEKITISA